MHTTTPAIQVRLSVVNTILDTKIWYFPVSLTALCSEKPRDRLDIIMAKTKTLIW